MNNNDLIFWIWFSRLEKITNMQKEKLLIKYKTPSKIWNLKETELQGCKLLKDEEIKEILDVRFRENLDKYCKYMAQNDIRVITIFDECYPKSLKNIYDKPIILYAKGNIKLLKEKSIAIVGARKCSEYGKEIAKKLAYNLSSNNMCIVSGLAIGIDKYSHIGALETRGNTIAVIGNGLDNIYPYENQNLANRIIKNNGLIISEYIIGTKPNRINFPARNRIISGLSDGIIVVEAKEKSGALITAEFGLEQGKEVFAVPGNIDSELSKGTNELIKDGANVVLNYKDVIDIINEHSFN